MRFGLFLFATVLLAQTTGSQHSPASKPRASAAQKIPVTEAPPAPALNTDDERIIYALGLNIQRSIGAFNLSPQELEIVKRAMSDGAAGKPAEDLSVWGPKIQSLAQSRAAHVVAQQKAASDAYTAKMAAMPGASQTPSGLIYREVTPGTGPSPKPTDTVKVNYRGTLADGTEFDSSYKRNEAAQFPLSGVIRCWTEGLQLMKLGGKSVLVCPSDLAYGDQGRPGIPGGAALTFEIELLGIVGPNQ
ncbi:MAG: FKBP-type peptidyl-prolyl cis-trans isomerase [Acidobacteriaceae bacterium]|nr:FKBP-type peptidyl-prolyl cis-trans isomerase [Acidobacteriaceae bacterium]